MSSGARPVEVSSAAHSAPPVATAANGTPATRTLTEAATGITIPVQFLPPWDDEEIDSHGCSLKR
jgi:hypothetical protein